MRAIGLDEGQAKDALGPSSCLLTPAAHAVLLRAALTQGGWVVERTGVRVHIRAALRYGRGQHVEPK